MPSDGKPDREGLRNKLIGLGERSMAKSYYPELQKRLDDLERFRAVVNNANDAIFVFETDTWNVIDVNETALILLGLKREEVSGSAMAAFFPPEIVARYSGVMPQESGLQFRNGHIVTWLTGRGGRKTPVEITMTVQRFAGRGYAVLVARDVTMRVQMEAELDRSRRMFSSFMEHTPSIAFIKDLEGQYLFCNPAFAEVSGLSQNEVLGRTDAQLWTQEVADLLRTNDQYVMTTGQPLSVLEMVVPAGGGSARYMQVSKFPLVQDGRQFALAGNAIDITVQIQAEQALQRSEERYRIVAEYNHDMECWLSPTGQMLYVSPSCERITGFERDHFLHNPQALADLILFEDREDWERFMQWGELGDSGSLDFRIRRATGETCWLNAVKREVMGGNGGSMGTRLSLRDITDRKEMELQLRHLALHDPLTGLANRTLALDRVRQAMERARRRNPYSFSLVFLDLDRFKILNDSLGHAFGDKVLMAVADVLRSSVRTLDTVARFGGDEFVILLEELDSPREVVQAIQRLRTNLTQPMTLAGHDLQLTASMGVTIGTKNADSPEDLLRNANIAMHQAKKAGRNRFKAFTPGMLANASRMLALETDLRRALKRDEFFMVYQPIVKLGRATELYGYEALVRWMHPRHGLVPPSEFIPAAEESGIIVELGKVVLKKSCEALQKLRSATPSAAGLVISVNISPRQFSDSSLVDTVTSVLAETGLPPANLKLEITETAIMDNAASAVERLRKLKTLGIALSIDDFGTGYSSMNSLQQFPLDSLKIDLSFVRRMDRSSEGLEIVKAIVSLAHSLRLQVIAEGVERSEQLAILTALGCEYAQGYFYSKPVVEEEAWNFFLSCSGGCAGADTGGK